MANDKLLKVMIALEGEPRIFECSAIEHQGAVWLVPRWVPLPEDEGSAMPERLIRLDQFAHKKLDQPGDPADFTINVPVPRKLFEGPVSRELQEQFVVLDRPNVKVWTGGALH